MKLQKPGLDYWLRQLEEQQLPAFASTAKAIVGCARSEDRSASDLAAMILQDVSMTTRLLRMANSIYFNRSQHRITTVSRAIVILGFNAVRDLCLSISIIDTFLHGPHRQRVVLEMARCFHAAVQARDLAKRMGEREVEEIFIATLLRRIGRLAFWCFASEVDRDTVIRLELALNNADRSRAEVERELLGFRIDELSTGLNKAWNLSPLLTDTLSGRPRLPRRCQLVEQSYRIVDTVEAGFEGSDFHQLVSELHQHFGLSTTVLEQAIGENAVQARDAIETLGLPEAARLIPDPAAVVSREGAEKPIWPEPDKTVQMEILQELSELLDETKPNFNLIIDMVMEGVYRGIGMDRCVVALLSRDRQRLQAKYSLGLEVERLESQFDFNLRETGSLIARVMREQHTVWIDQRAGFGDKLAMDSKMKTISGGAFLLMPLSVDGRSIGCLYADRKPSRRTLDEACFGAFRMFGQQARLALSVLAR